MTFWQLPLIQLSAMNGSIHYLLRFALVLVGLFGIFCCIDTILELRGSGAILTGRKELAAKVSTLAGKMGLLILGTLIGMGWSNYQFYANRYHYDRVVIVAKRGPSDYDLQPEKMQPFKAHTCAPVNWEVGQRMKWIDLHFSPECDDVGLQGSYEFEDTSTKEIAHE